MKKAVGAANSKTSSAKAIKAIIFLSFDLTILEQVLFEPARRTIVESLVLGRCLHR